MRDACSGGHVRRGRLGGRGRPAVDAGHDVTGVHLALSRNPQTYRSGARGCCTLEDARDARRAADVIGIPFYVWDMAEQFHEDVVDDFVAEYAAGRTPNPCLRCNEKIKFAAVLDRALALGFDAVVTGHHARLGADGLLRRCVDPAKDQSYVLAVLTRDQLDRSIFPLGDSTKAQVRAEAAERGLAVAEKPDSHDICFIADGDTQGFLAARLGAAPGDIVDASTGDVLGQHDGAFGYTVGQRKGLDLDRPGAGRPAALRAVDHAGHQHRRRRAGRGARRRRWCTPTVRCGRPGARRRPTRRCECEVQMRAHGETVGRVDRRSTATARSPRRSTRRSGGSRPARRSSPTAATRPATSCSARPRSRARTVASRRLSRRKRTR